MSKNGVTLFLGTFFAASLFFSNFALANNDHALILLPNELNQPLEIEPFVAQKHNSQTPSKAVILHDPYPTGNKEFKYQAKKKPMEERLIALVPYGQEMKHLWNIADGDVDLMGIKGLRGDRKNKGVEYKTSSLPLIGSFDDTEFEFEAGEDVEFSFQTSSLPFGREIEGFNFKGSVGEDARVSARYTIKFD